MAIGKEHGTYTLRYIS